MLNKSLNELPIIALTRSDRVLDICLRHLTSLNDGGASPLSHKPRQQQFKRAIKETLYDMRAHQLRWDDIDRVLQKYWHQTNNGCFSLDCLEDIADFYLDFEGDHFAVKANRCTEYQALINHIHPGFLIASLYVKQLNGRQLSASALPALLKTQSPLGFAVDHVDEVYADNHVHLGGVQGAEVLTRFLFDRVDRQQLKKLKLPRVPEFTLINSENNIYDYSVGTLVSVYRLLFDEFCRYSFSEGFGESTDGESSIQPLANLPKQLKAVLKQAPLNTSSKLYSRFRLSNKSAATPQQSALLEMVKQVRKGNSHQALTAFCCALLMQQSQKNQSAQIQTLTMALIHLVNILRSYVVMSGVGLTHFVDFFISDIRRFNRDKGSKESLRWLLNGNNKAALKVAPPVDSLDALVKTTNQVAGVLNKTTDLEKSFHFCLHFSRAQTGKFSAGMEDKKRQDMRQQVFALRRLLKSQLKFTIKTKGKPSTKHGTKLPSQSIRVQDLVRGFDVAGNENHFPIHVFAPALRYLREKPLTIKQLNGHVHLAQRRHLSIHAGEDYSHLITGLRHIDETVRYCRMRKGDRLGHALALGVMPDQWAKRQHQAFVTPEENLWNTVWLLHYARDLSVAHPQALQLVAYFEQRLESWQKSWFSHSFTHDELWSYWQNRANSYQHEKRLCSHNNLNDRQYWIINEDSQNLTAKFANIRAQLQLLNRSAQGRCAITVHLFDEHLQHKPWTHQSAGDDNDYWVSKQELTLYQLIQDHLMMEYDYKGITLEVCPSSNISLGRFEQYHQHPIFRWFPPDESLFESLSLDPFGIRNKGEVAVCINTDDPGIFPTTIEQEYQLLLNAAKQHYGLSSQAAEMWIERLRLLSLRVFSAA
ncbi:MAG: adenosine deaminase [Phenylobacterium sp.]|jgi:adenosine deaminase